MDAARRRHLSVELEISADSLSGTVADGLDEAERFGSWLELMSVVEARRPREIPAVLDGGDAPLATEGQPR